MNKNKDVGEYATYQIKIPHELWKKLKIKTITDNEGTYGDAILRIMESHVSK